MSQASLDRANGRLTTALKEVCATQWAERLVDWKIVGRWTRFYSEVRLIELRTSTASHRLIAKRALRRGSNDIYHQRGDIARHEWQALRQAEECCGPLPHGGVPRALGVVPGDDLLLLEYVPGADLDRQIAGARMFTPYRKQHVAQRHFERLGAWLAAYQRGTTTQLGVDAVDQLLVQCQHRLAALPVSASKISPDRVRRIGNRLERLHQEIVTPLEGSACHGDFGPWNVLVTDDRLTVLDFFCQHVDSIWVDPLNVVTYLRTQQPSVSLSRRRVQRLVDAFLCGYARPLETDRPEFRLVWALQQICRWQDALSAGGRSWSDRYRRWHVVRQICRDLVDETHPPAA
jgi:hypothetical protein